VSEKLDLPRGWIELEFGELFTLPSDDIVDGPFGSNLKASEYVTAGTPIARLQNIDRNLFISKNIQYVTNDKAEELVRHTFVPGDILITKLGDPLGKACHAPDGIARGVLVADVVRARITHQWVDRRFLCYQINANYIIEQFKDQTKGTTRPRVNLTKIRALKARLCPLAEQTRIVAKLEELLSDLDAGIDELKAAQIKMVKYRQSLLKSAVEGALTAKWRSQNPLTETGAQLLQRILSERRSLWEAKQLAKFQQQGKIPLKDWQKKYPEPAQPSTIDLPELPGGWVWASLDMLGEIASGVAKGTKRSADVEVREVPYLRVANVQRGFLDLSEVKNILATEREIAELALRAGDVLFNEGGDRDKLGRGWVWREEVANCIHQNHVFRMRPYLSEVLPELVSHHGNTFGKTWFQNAGKQTTNLASINMTMLRMFPVPLGPAEEQREVLNQLELQIEHLNRQERAIEVALKQSTIQRQHILRTAFAGQLVSQDPNDEPAGVLLERIRAEGVERAKQPKVRKTKQQKEIAAVVRKLIDVLAEAGDWVPAQEAFRRCGVADGALTDQIELLYAELRALDKSGRLTVEAVTDAKGRKLHDRLKLLVG
jgi:type I restriction enzyme, S subunit